MAAPTIAVDITANVEKLISSLEKAVKQGKDVLGTLGDNVDLISVDEINKTRTAIDSLGGVFDQGAQASQKMFNAQKQALAQLALDGKKGTTEWDKQVQALKEAEGSAKKYDQALGLVDQELDKVKQSGGLMTGALNMAAVTSSIDAMGQALGAVQGPFLELDKQVRNIGTLGVEGFEDFAKLTTNLSKKVPDDAAKLAEATYNAISAGISGTNEEIIAFVETASQAAVAGVSDTNTSVNALTSVINAYKLEATDAQEVSDTFFAGIKLGKTSFQEMSAGLANVIPAASAAGIQFKEVTGIISQMTALGVPTAQATTQIRAAIIELQKPGKPLADVMEKIGLSAANMGEQLKNEGLAATLQQIEGAASSMGLSMVQVFSSSEAASASMLVTGENAARTNKVLQQVDQEIANGAASGAFEIAAEGAEVKSKIIGNKIQAFFNGIFGSLGSTINGALGALTNFAPVLSALGGLTVLGNNAIGIFTQMGEKGITLSSAFSSLGTKMKGMGSSIASFGKKGLDFMFSMKGAALGAAAGIALILFSSEEGKEAMKEIGDALSSAIAPIISSVMPLITGIIDAIKPILDAITGVITGIVGSLGGAFADIVGGMVGVFGQLFGVIGPLLQTVMDVITPIITAVGGSLFAAFSNVAEVVSTTLGTLVGIFTEVFATLQPIITSLTETLTPIFEQLGEVIGEVFQTVGLTIAGLVQSFVPIILQLAETLGPIITLLAETFGMLFKTVAETFGGILEVVVPIVGELVGTIGTLLGNLLNQILPLLLPLLQTLSEVFATGLSQVATILSEVFGAIAPIIGNVVGAVTPIITTLVEVITGVLGTVLPIVTGILQQLLGLLGPVLGTLGELIGTIANTLGTVLADAFKSLAPVLQQLAGVVGGVLSTLGDTIGVLLTSLAPVITGLVDVLGTILPVIAQLATTLLTALAPVVTVIVGVLGQLLGIVGGLVGTIVTALQPVLLTLANLFGSIFEVVGKVLSQLAENLAPLLATLGEAFGELVGSVGGIVAELAQALVPVLQMVAEVVGVVVGWLADKLGDTLKVLTPVITTVATVLVNVLARNLEFVVKILTKVMKFLTPIITAIGKWLVGAIKTAVKWLRGAFADALTWVQGAIQTVSAWIGNLVGHIEWMVNWVRQAAAVVVNFAKDIPILGDVISWISGAIESLIGWIKDAVGWLLKLFGIFDDNDDVADRIKKIDEAIPESDLRGEAPKPRPLPPPGGSTGGGGGGKPVDVSKIVDPYEKEIAELGNKLLERETQVAEIYAAQRAKIRADETLAEEDKVATIEILNKGMETEITSIAGDFAKLRYDAAVSWDKKGNKIAKEAVTELKKSMTEAGESSIVAFIDLDDFLDTKLSDTLKGVTDDVEGVFKALEPARKLLKEFRDILGETSIDVDVDRFLKETLDKYRISFGGISEASSVELDAFFSDGSIDKLLDDVILDRVEIFPDSDALAKSLDEALDETIFGAKITLTPELKDLRDAARSIPSELLKSADFADARAKLNDELVKVEEDHLKNLELIREDEAISEEVRSALILKAERVANRLRADALRAFAKEAEKIERESIEVRAGLIEQYSAVAGEAILGAIRQSREKRDEEEDAHAKRIKEIDEESATLAKAFRKADINSTEFVRRTDELASKLGDSVSKASTVWDDFGDAALGALGKVADGIKALSDESLTDLQLTMDDAFVSSVKAIVGVDGAMADTTTTIALAEAQMGDALLNLGAATAASFAKIATSSDNFFEDTIGLLQDVAAEAIKALAPLLAGALSFLGPFAVPAAILATQALAAFVKSIDFFEDGGLVTGGMQMIGVNEKGPEYIVPAGPTKQLGKQLDKIRKSDYSLDPLGNIIFTPIPPGTPVMPQGGVTVVTERDKWAEKTAEASVAQLNETRQLRTQVKRQAAREIELLDEIRQLRKATSRRPSYSPGV